MAYHEPTVWRFNEADRTRYASRSWHMPTRLVVRNWLGAVWAHTPDDADRGHVAGAHAASSVLPILALHNWPDAEHTKRHGFPPGAAYTGWAKISARRLATLAGIDKGTALAALAHLEARGDIQTRRWRDLSTGGPPRLFYALSRALFPAEGETWVPLPGTLFYGGLWAGLPYASCRHLYLVIAGLDAVRDEQAFGEAVGERESLDPAEAVRGARERNPLSLTALSQLSGISREEVVKARNILCAPTLTTATGALIPYVLTGAARGRSAWYAPNRDAQGFGAPPDTMNTPALLRKVRRWMVDQGRTHGRRRAA